MRDTGCTRIRYLASFTSRGAKPHATHSPTNCSVRSPDARDSCRSSCKPDARASADYMSSKEPVSARPGAGAGGDCHGGGAKLLFLVRHPLLYSKSFLGACCSRACSKPQLTVYLSFYPSRLFKTSNRSSSSSSWQPQSPRFRSAPQFGQSPLQSGRQNACMGSASSAYSRRSSPTSSR